MAGHVARINSDRDIPSPTCQRSFRREFTIRAKWGFLRKTLVGVLPVVDWIHPPSIGRNSTRSLSPTFSPSSSLFLGCSAFIGSRRILTELPRFRYVFYLRARRRDADHRDDRFVNLTRSVAAARVARINYEPFRHWLSSMSLIKRAHHFRSQYIILCYLERKITYYCFNIKCRQALAYVYK